MSTVLGIDLGGTNVKAAVVTANGHVLASASELSRVSEGPNATFARVAELAKRMHGRHGFVSIGVAICAPVDPVNGRIVKSASLPGWLDVPVMDMLTDRMNVPIVLENDAACAILAEWWMGAGERAPIVAGLTLGTGIGGGLVLDGQIYRGSSGWAGEFGHIPLADGPDCPCSGRGCLARLASGQATEERYRTLGGRPGIGTAEIVTLADRGDQRAMQALDETIEYLTRGVRTLVNVLNPDVFVVCGGMANWGAPLIDAIKGGLRGTTFPGLDETPIRQSQLGLYAGAVGAARLALDF